MKRNLSYNGLSLVIATAALFSAIAPAQAGAPCACRACNAPLPDVGAGLVARCVYCQTDSVVRMARPRLPSRVKDDAKKLEETLDMRSAEQLTRLIFLVVVGVPSFLLALALQTWLSWR